MSDLLVRAAQGDMEAFCRVVDEFEGRLLRQAIALCGNQTTAEELAQQTWVEAWKSLPRFDYSCRFTTWLYAILLHLHHKHVRQTQRRPIPFSWLNQDDSGKTQQRLQETPSVSSTPHDTLLEKEWSEEWRQSLERLPEIHREVILLRYFEDASLEEIASVTGCSVGTAKTRLHHALKKLRNMKTIVNFSKLRRDT